MNKISLLFLLALSFLLACASKPLFKFTAANSISYKDGLYQRQVDLVAEKQRYSCFFELVNQHIVGVSCQNSIGFAEFAGGTMGGQSLHYEISNPALSKAEAQFVVDLLYLSIVDNYQLVTSKSLKIIKQTGNLQVMNSDNQLLFQVSE